MMFTLACAWIFGRLANWMFSQFDAHLGTLLDAPNRSDARLLARCLITWTIGQLDVCWLALTLLASKTLIARTRACSHFLTWCFDTWMFGRFHACFHTFALLLLAQMMLITPSSARHLDAWVLGHSLLRRRCSFGHFSYFLFLWLDTSS